MPASSSRAAASRAAALSLIVLSLVAALALSTAALAAGRGDAKWATHTRKSGYRYDAGWLGFKAGGAPPASLRSISGGSAAVGLACGAVLAASALLAGIYAAVVLCGGGGPHIAAAATPAR